jgi:hypothetical protein
MGAGVAVGPMFGCAESTCVGSGVTGHPLLVGSDSPELRARIPTATSATTSTPATVIIMSLITHHPVFYSPPSR